MIGPDLTSVLDNGKRLKWYGKMRAGSSLGLWKTPHVTGVAQKRKKEKKKKKKSAEVVKLGFSLVSCVSKITFKHTAICIYTRILNILRYHFSTVSEIPSLEVITISLTIHTSNVFFPLKNPRKVVSRIWHPTESHDLVQILSHTNYNFEHVRKSL